MIHPNWAVCKIRAQLNAFKKFYFLFSPPCFIIADIERKAEERGNKRSLDAASKNTFKYFFF